MKILFRFDASDTLIRKVESLAGDGVEIACAPESSDEHFLQRLTEADVLWHVLKPVTAEQISRAPKLRLIQKIGTGVNTIDLEAARARGIAVCNLPGTNSRAVAEMTLALMLACLRRLTELDAMVRTQNGWHDAWSLQDAFGEIGGRTIGLIGFGAVPRLLKPILEAMGARVLYWSRSTASASLDELLAHSDIVSLHVPLTAETRSFFDPRRMKRGSIFVNTARGGLVDEAALIEALRSGHLQAAGLDVFSEEPLPPGHPLLARNVVAAPHLAWLTQETIARSLGLALENARKLRGGSPLENRVL